jgi:glycosyltransferase involved in cell wall biosynthesis
MKIAIASSGLGHIARGIETWAADTAVALEDVRGETLDVRRAGGVRGEEEGEPFQVTLFCAAPLPRLTSHASPLTIRVIPCWKRGDKLVKLLTRISPRFTWRWGWTSGYDIEQRSFWRHLWPILRDEGYDILHVQDPRLADLCRQYRKAGKLKTKEILAHGTEEPMEFLEKFDYLQELTPHYAERHVKGRPGQIIGVAPNFVDTRVFSPAGNRKEECRRKLGIPPDAFVVLSVGSINRGRKRMDYLVSEFARWARKDAVLVIAGACDSDESKALVAEAMERLGGRLIILEDLERGRMPDIYAVADIFVLCALQELFGIAFLEAMACGIPCIGHHYPVTEWVIGASTELVGGLAIDMSKKGELAEALAGLTPEWIAEHGRQARARAVAMFSKEAVIGQYVKYYREVRSEE